MQNPIKKPLGWGFELGNFMLTWGSLYIFLEDMDRGRESEGSFSRRLTTSFLSRVYFALRG